MNKTIFARALVIFVSTTTLASPGRSQTPEVKSVPVQQAGEQHGVVRILFTGRSMGHFRMPDLQGKEEGGGGCPSTVPKSVAAMDFEDAFEAAVREEPAQPVILLGAGDNFAPELEARNFCKDPAALNGAHLGKEFYVWDDQHPGPRGGQKGAWVLSPAWHKDDVRNTTTLAHRLATGEAIIPFDNAGNFFVEKGYAALVPGKHDFYFGPERLHQFAKYLASALIPDGAKTQHTQGVQMLGANVVVETNWKTGHKGVSDTDAKLTFVPRLPTVKDFLGIQQQNLKERGLDRAAIKLTGISDGVTVYPWFQKADLQVTGGNPDILDAVEKAKVYLCSTKDGDPNAIASVGSSDCAVVDKVRAPKADQILFHLELRNDYGQALKPGRNYGLRFLLDNANHASDIAQKNYGASSFCLRFSVYTPLFQRTSWPTLKQDNYREPDAYVLLHTTEPNEVQNDIAIFGVVDPRLGDYVGTLNLAWENSAGDKYKTQVAMKDPAEALNEVLDYFEAQNPCWKEEAERPSGCPANKKLTRILLAQMSPQEAQILATRVKKFDVVVSGADSELAGVDRVTTTVQQRRFAAAKSAAILAIPAPYYAGGSTAAGEMKSQWAADVGSLTLTDQPDGSRKAVLEHFVHGFAGLRVPAPAGFWDSVSNYLNEHCLEKLPSSYQKQQPQLTITAALSTDESDQAQQLQWLAACVVQKSVGADVVLFQKRDFFTDLPYTAETQPDSYQEFLGRLLWKGDFLTLIYVPGRSLEAAMKQSKLYDADDASKLSLSNETKRGLVAVGMRFDSAHNEYLINEVPLDKNRLYAVATSDYIGAGDTGYPDLAASAVRNLGVPKDFDKRLVKISGLVCNALPSKGRGCVGDVNRDEYFDHYIGTPNDTRANDSIADRLWAWSIFHHDKDVPGVSKSKDASPQSDRMEQAVEHRGIGSTRINQPNGTLFTLNSSLSVNVTNHKFSDGSVGATFAGNPTPQLSARDSHAIGYDIQPTLSYSWHRRQLFLASEERYNVQYTGQPNALRTINQKENLLTVDPGLAIDFPDRSYWHIEAVESLHYETQMVGPSPSTLAPLPKGSSLAPGANTSRTHYILPRSGARFVNRTSWIEAGMEGGTQLNAVRLIPTPPAPANTVFQLRRTSIPVSGSYWRWHLVVPFSAVMTWTLDEDGDFFFNQHGDSITDTRFRSDTKTQINFQVLPSLSFAPTYEFFYYSNKVRQDWYWQGQTSVQMKFRFDLWNKNRAMDQIKYKIPSQ